MTVSIKTEKFGFSLLLHGCKITFEHVLEGQMSLFVLAFAMKRQSSKVHLKNKRRYVYLLLVPVSPLINELQ